MHVQVPQMANGMMKVWSIQHMILAKMDVLQSFVLYYIFFDAKYDQSYWMLQEVNILQT